MLTTVRKSGDKKTGAMAVTYRSGSTIFGTCPNSCALKPAHEKGAEKIDLKYFKAVAESVPRNGIAWTYIHFNWRDWKPALNKMGKRARTIFNFSADTIDQALDSVAQKIATTLPVPESWHADKKSFKINHSIIFLSLNFIAILQHLSYEDAVLCTVSWQLWITITRH